MSKKIVFKVTKNGDVDITHVEGYGSSCMDATKLLERKIGLADESSRKVTEEFLCSADNSTEEHIHQ